MTFALTPAQLGLPEKFREFRPQQVTALEKIARSDKKVILCQAPTGAGKTLLMGALGRYLKKSLVYTCHTKQLQQQVVDDFPYAVELKGRSNYFCVKGQGLTCNECTMKRGNRKPSVCKVCEYQSCPIRPIEGKKRNKSETEATCPCKLDCPYEIQKGEALAAEIAVLNTPFFLNEANFAGGFSEWPLVVLDEGDLMKNALMSFIEVSLSKSMIQRLRLEPPRKTAESTWPGWIQNLAIPAIKQHIKELEDGLSPFEIREKQDLERLLYRLSFFINQNLNNWVFIPSETSWTWKPVFVGRYAQHNLWRHGEKFLVMSATIISPRQFARDLGLDPEEVEFIDLPSTFPPERRPIHVFYVADVSHKNKEAAWPQVVRAIDKIIADHPNDKGLIHTHSYELARYVYDNSEHKARLMQHDTLSRVTELERFKAESQPKVLISPSMERGTDLPGDMCRFIVVAKVPYPYLGDPQIARRLYSASDGNLWYAVQTIRSIVQATGRGMRSADDYCESFILDEQFGRLFSEYSSLFPQWWKEALVRK